MTLGAFWGAWLLIQICTVQSFTALPLNDVNAHGHAQIFGWVGLFVMGFSYKLLPLLKRTDLHLPHLARTSFPLMLGGVIMRTVGEAGGSSSTTFGLMGEIGSAMEITAVGAFTTVVLKTVLSSKEKLEASDYFILSAIAWFLLQTIYDAIFFRATFQAHSQKQLLHVVSVWQAPLREMQIHGFAMLMVMGMSQAVLPRFFAVKIPSHRGRILSLAMINAGVLATIAGFLLMRTRGHSWAGVWYLGTLAIAWAIIRMVRQWQIFRRDLSTERSFKFIQAGFLWLLVSIMLLVLLPVYQFLILPFFAAGSAADKMGFSHAYYGAIRHAITVGFISLMMVGVSSRLIPLFRRRSPTELPALWIPFILINLGCAIRVSGQILTDFNNGLFMFTGISGILEVCGLGLWGAHLLILMSQTAAGSADEFDGQPIGKNQ